MEPIRILIVDDQRLMREGLRTLLELESDLEVAAEAEDGQVAIEQYEALQPDVVLMDIRMPRLDGVEATRRLRQRWPAARVIILTTFDDDAYVFDGLRAGALGYLLKDVSGQELADAIRKVAGGRRADRAFGGAQGAGRVRAPGAAGQSDPRPPPRAAL
jgi:DNA-binding NarL/FixJ family response regulator